MSKMFGLDKLQIEAIINCFEKNNYVEKVIIYGSRVKGTFNDRSDIDLAVIGLFHDRFVINNLKDEIDELNIPYKIDIQEYENIQNKMLLEHIQRVGQVFYKRKDFLKSQKNANNIL